MKRLLIILLTIIPFTLCGAIVYAPYLPRLIAEGYPSSTWPANGYYTEVKGTEIKPVSPRSRTIRTDWLRELLKKSGTRTFLIYHNGKLELEYYADSFNTDTRFNSFSAVKSLVGILVFKAVAEGKLSSLDTPIGTYLSEIKNSKLKKSPIRAFMDMRSDIIFEPDGLKTASGYEEKDLERAIANPFGPMARLHVSGPDGLIPRLIGSEDGSGQFNYQNVNTALLGRLLEKVYNKSLSDVLSEKIWKPAGAQTAYWRLYHQNGHVSAYCCLYARARDWLQVARFITDNGKPDTPFLPKSLWKQFMGLDLEAQLLRNGHYANHSRYNILDRKGEPLQGPFAYFLGQGGQVIYFMPQTNLIVIRFGKQNQLLHSTLYAAWREIKQQAQSQGALVNP